MGGALLAQCWDPPCFSSGLNVGVRNPWEQSSHPYHPTMDPQEGGEMCAPSHNIALANKGLCPLQSVLLGREGGVGCGVGCRGWREGWGWW